MSKQYQKGMPIVAYLRTSTDDQLLGIDAQEATVVRIAETRGVPIDKTFIEHESGGNSERAELGKAIRHARSIGATLVVAKLDRLARDSQFLMRLYDGNVPVIFGDLPEVDGTASGRFVVQMIAAVAEFERRRIRERTREALAALKKQGRQLGKPENLTSEGRLKGTKTAASKRIAKAVQAAAEVAPKALEKHKAGLSLREIAVHLNDLGYATPRGKDWTAVQVRRVLVRFGVDTSPHCQTGRS